MPPIDRILKVEGQVPPHVGVELADLAHNVSSQHVIVDIGTYRGRSACYLAFGASQGEKAVVHAIDAWDLPGNERVKSYPYNHAGSRKAARYNVRAQGFANDITLTRDWSGRAAANWKGRPVGLLHVDGDPGLIKNDILAWLPRMAELGVIAVSDYHRNDHAARSVAELAADGLISDYSVSNGLILVQIPPRIEKVHAGDLVGFEGEAERLKDETVSQVARLVDAPKSHVAPDTELPGMWEEADTTGGETDAYQDSAEPDMDLEKLTILELKAYMENIGMKKGSNRPKKEMIADIRAFLEYTP